MAPNLRIETDLGVFAAGASPDHFHSVFVAARWDGTAPCGVRLVWKLKQQAVKLSVGSVIRHSTAVNVRSVEDDVPVTAVARDEDGKLLIGYAAGARPAVWDSRVWPEVALHIEEPAVCKDAQRNNLELLRFSLVAGEARCSLEAKSARCCDLFGDGYVAKASDAIRKTSTGTEDTDVPLESVNVIVARKSILTHAP